MGRTRLPVSRALAFPRERRNRHTHVVHAYAHMPSTKRIQSASATRPASRAPRPVCMSGACTWRRSPQLASSPRADSGVNANVEHPHALRPQESLAAGTGDALPDAFVSRSQFGRQGHSRMLSPVIIRAFFGRAMATPTPTPTHAHPQPGTQKPTTQAARDRHGLLHRGF